jgi:hypothetical protein
MSEPSELSIFADVRYYIAPTLAPELAGELARILNANGGTHVALEHATHVISNTDKYDGWQTAPDSTHVVTVGVSLSFTLCPLSWRVNGHMD